LEYLGYIFVFYVGFYFYRLAENHEKNKWLFGVIGILIFFTGYFSYILFYRFFELKSIEEIDYSSISFKSFLIGSIAAIIMFQTLNLVWNRKKKISSQDINEIGKNESRNNNNRR
jgi:hypothetical protein